MLWARSSPKTRRSSREVTVLEVFARGDVCHGRALCTYVYRLVLCCVDLFYGHGCRRARTRVQSEALYSSEYGCKAQRSFSASSVTESTIVNGSFQNVETGKRRNARNNNESSIDTFSCYEHRRDILTMARPGLSTTSTRRPGCCNAEMTCSCSRGLAENPPTM